MCHQVNPRSFRRRPNLILKEPSELPPNQPAEWRDQESERREEPVSIHPHGNAWLSRLEQLFQFVLPVAVGANSVNGDYEMCGVRHASSLSARVFPWGNRNAWLFRFRAGTASTTDAVGVTHRSTDNIRVQ